MKYIIRSVFEDVFFGVCDTTLIFDNIDDYYRYIKSISNINNISINITISKI